MLAAVLLAMACTGGEPAPVAGPALPFDQAGAPPPIQLDTLPASLSLASASLAGEAVPDAFDLPVVEPSPSDDGSGRFAWTWDVPFVLDEGQERFAPPGMQVFVNGAEVGYDISPYAPGRTGWRIKDGQLHVVLAEALGPQGAKVVHPALVAEVRRLDAPTSGLSPEEFAHFSWTRDGTTRPGLLLPAPSSAEWTVTLPRGARFRAAPDLVEVSLRGAGSDGAEVALIVSEGGTATEAGSARVVPGGVAGFGGWGKTSTHWDVDLSAWSGRSVTLRIETRVYGETAHDWVFVGTPVVWGEATAPARRVVVIGIDTLRPDRLGFNGYARPTSPELDAFAATAQVFDRTWAPAPRTRPSFRTAQTGRRPLDAVGAPNMGQVFHQNGFATAGIVANVHLNPRFGFDDGYDLWHLDAAGRAGDQVDRALAWLGEHPDRDAFLFLHLMDPHLFYDAPGAWRTKFVEGPEPPIEPVFNRWQIVEWSAQGLIDDSGRKWIGDLYDGEVAYTSHELGRFLEGLEKLGGNDLVVIHTDHGEELFDHGGFEHNHTLYEEVVRALLWIRPPDGRPAARFAEPASLEDIAPTLYEYAGFQGTPPSDGRSLVPLIAGTDPGGWDRPLPIGHLMYDVEQWGVVWRDHKYVIETASGQERIFDLAKDPKETRTAASVDMQPWREALGKAHGMTVGPGWRIEIDLRSDEPLIFTLPAKALAAGVVDPEAAMPNRANLEWGEAPFQKASDVGTVALSKDGKTLTIEPGSLGVGIVWVRFAKPTPPGGTVMRGNGPVTMSDGAGDSAFGMAPATRIIVRSGTVLEPPPDEASRMAALGAADPADIELLRALGYVGGTREPEGTP